MIVGSFGVPPYVVVFSVSSDLVRTFRGGSRERGSAFAIHEPIGQAPRLEPLHPDLDVVRLAIELDQDLGTSPALELVGLNELMKLQASGPLILGPVPMGEYVITKIEEEWKRFSRSGVLAKVGVGLHLLQDSEMQLAGEVGSVFGL